MPREEEEILGSSEGTDDTTDEEMPEFDDTIPLGKEAPKSDVTGKGVDATGKAAGRPATDESSGGGSI